MSCLYTAWGEIICSLSNENYTNNVAIKQIQQSSLQQLQQAQQQAQQILRQAEKIQKYQQGTELR